MLVINHFAGPGAGKSTTAADVFVRLKRADLRAELVTEYAKDMVYEKRPNILQDQIYILAKQNRRLLRLMDQGVDFAVTDSPLLLTRIYNREIGDTKLAIDQMAKELFNRHDNFNVFIDRVKPYQEYGRGQTYKQACELDEKIVAMLNDLGVSFLRVAGDERAAETIFNIVTGNEQRN